MDDGLLSKYLAGEAGDEERARLRAALEADPSLADALFEAAELEADLVQTQRRAAAPRRRRWIALAAAAALLVAAAIAFFRGGADLPRVELVEGRVTPPLAPGDRLPAGQDLEVSRGRLVLRYEDGTRVELGAGTALKDLEDGKGMTLARGMLSADVAKQSGGRAMVVRTAEGEARVLGTRFTLSARPGATRLAVEKGQVRLTRRSDGASANVGAGQVAVASTSSAPAALTFSPGTWVSVPGSTMSRVVPDPGAFPNVQAVSGPRAVIEAWSGAAFDTRRNRLVLWGGGYGDYFGNELYAFSAETLAWERLTDPSPSPRLNQERNDDGTPSGRATYNGLAYLAHADRFFGIGGCLAGKASISARTPWSFDFDARRWTPGPPCPSGGVGGVCTVDPATRTVWWGDGTGLYSLGPQATSWTKQHEDGFYYQTGAFDTKRGLWILVGAGQVFSYDLRSPRPVRTVWKTSGADAVVAATNPGVDYDPVRDRVVAWAGGPVCALDPEARRWSVTDAPGAPRPTPNGIFGRWRYVPDLDAFIVVTAIDQDVHFYKP
ncbi:MAG TPA: FecR family protein [Planctomycetota bacterium]|jgi:ferric-dicitrate binding protein FerR (iron transport regulator)|nr:FecR family protein [Planctomycetota bacterium]